MSLNKLLVNLIKIILLILAGISVSHCSRTGKNDLLVFSGNTMGTTYNIQIVAQENVSPEILSKKIKLILNDVEQSMSTWRSDSELSRLNNTTSSEWLTVSKDLLYVLKLAQSVSKKTNGAFDITLDPLINLWGFSSHKIQTSIPDEKNILMALQKVGYRNLYIDPERHAIKKGIPIRINLSAIAKGYAVDKIAEYFNNQSINSYLIEVGGELRLKGHKKDGQLWSIAIETPSTGERKPFKGLMLTDHAIATSGDYRNYYEIKGKRYSHTIDPVTGYPVTHGLASVTVISKTAAYADAVATALMVMGSDKGYHFCEKNKIPAYFVFHKNNKFNTKYTSYMKKYLATH